MVMSKASTVQAYLDEQPADRRFVLSKLRGLIQKRLPKGYVETMSSGMICYVIPLERYPDTYNGHPLCYAGLAAQKNNFSLYLMCAYMNAALTKRLTDGFAAIGKRPDMGKSCIRFKTLEDIPLETIGDVVAAVPLEKYLEYYEAARAKTKSGARSKAAKARPKAAEAARRGAKRAAPRAKSAARTKPRATSKRRTR